MPLLATLTTIVALSRVQAGPLATSRHGRRPPPSARRALPLAAGIGGLLAAAPLRRVVDSETRDRGAPHREWSDPSATFGAVSVVVLAAFAVTSSASLVDAAEDGPVDGGRGVLRPGVVEAITGGVPQATVAPLLSERAVPIRCGAAGDFVESCPELARRVTLSCSSSGLPEGGIRERPGSPTPTYRSPRCTSPPTAPRPPRTAFAPRPPTWCRTRSSTPGGTGSTPTRSSALLRASGLRLGELRQVMFLETAAAMLVTAAVGVGLGMASS